MKPILLLALLIAPTLQAATLQPLSDTETVSLLDRLAASRRDTASQSDFREEKTLAMMKNPVIEHGTIAFRPPNMFRREVPGKSLTVCDGRTLWMYYPAFKEAEKYPLAANRKLRESLAAMTAGLGLQEVARSYTVTAWRGDDGGFRLELVPRSSALRRSVAKITLDLDSSLSATRMQIDSPSGERSITTFSNEKKVDLSPEDFTFRPPAGVTVSEPLGG